MFVIAEYDNRPRVEVKQETGDGGRIVLEQKQAGEQRESLLQRAVQSVPGKKARKAGGDDEIGNVEAICPYCGAILEKKPERKKRCPECRRSMFVVTRPSDGVEVLVREEQVEEIERMRRRWS